MVSYPQEDVGEGKVKAPLTLPLIFLSADEHTLRKRGLLVAAVLFITGIIILTSENWGWVGRAPRPGWGL